MKMQKLDQKQVPQVIALGVLSVGVLGYAAFSIAFSGPKRGPQTTPAAASASASTSSTSAPLPPGVALETAPGNGVQVTQNSAPEIPLPSQYNPDPFRTAVKPDAAGKPSPVAITPKEAAPAPASTSKPPVMPDASRALPLLVQAPVPVKPPAPAAPEKPDVRVTGTSVVEGMNLAILEVGQDHRVVQVGDLVAKGYRVKKIQLEGVLFASKKDSFFRPVGVKEEPRKAEAGEAASSDS